MHPFQATFPNSSGQGTPLTGTDAPAGQHPSNPLPAGMPALGQATRVSSVFIASPAVAPGVLDGVQGWVFSGVATPALEIPCWYQFFPVSHGEPQFVSPAWQPAPVYADTGLPRAAAAPSVPVSAEALPAPTPQELDRLIRRKTLARTAWDDLEGKIDNGCLSRGMDREDCLVWVLKHPGRVMRLQLYDPPYEKPLNPVESALLSRVLLGGGLGERAEIALYLDPIAQQGDPGMRSLFDTIRASKLAGLSLALPDGCPLDALLPWLEGISSPVTLMPVKRVPAKDALQQFVQQHRDNLPPLRLCLRTSCGKPANDQSSRQELAELTAILRTDLPVHALHLGMPGEQALFDAIVASTSLEILEYDASCDEHVFQVFLPVLVSGTSLRRLELHQVPRACAAGLLERLQANTTLESAKIELGHWLNDEGAEDLSLQLAMLLTRNSTLRELELNRVKLEPGHPEGKASLLKAFAANSTLRKLVLQLTDHDKGLMGELLAVNHGLQTLAFKGWRVEAVPMGRALQTNTSLASLKIYGFGKRDYEGIGSFAQALKKNTSLTSLQLLNNKARSAHMAGLVSALETNTSLQVLASFDGNGKRTFAYQAPRAADYDDAPTSTAAGTAVVRSTSE